MQPFGAGLQAMVQELLGGARRLTRRIACKRRAFGGVDALHLLLIGLGLIGRRLYLLLVFDPLGSLDAGPRSPPIEFVRLGLEPIELRLSAPRRTRELVDQPQDHLD